MRDKEKWKGESTKKVNISPSCHLFCSQFSKIVLRVEGKDRSSGSTCNQRYLDRYVSVDKASRPYFGGLFEVTSALLRRMPLKRKCPGGDAWKLAISRR